MSPNRKLVKVRPARPPELPGLARLLNGHLADLMKSTPAGRPGPLQRHLDLLVRDRTLLLAIDQRKLSGLAALDLDQARIMALHLDPDRASATTTRDLLAAIEQTALDYGLQQLSCTVRPQAWAFMERMGYEAVGLADESRPIELRKPLLAQASDAHIHLIELHAELSIPADYGVRHRLRVIEPAHSLAAAGLDMFGRETELAPEAAEAWYRMRDAALEQDISLQLVSGFRTVDYQAGLIRKKLNDGQPIERILRVSAAPGYSEHHSGLALDLGTPGTLPLDIQFADTRAYKWLCQHARIFGFRESYGQRNHHGIDWEPWHWCFTRFRAASG
ncbi:MAG: M15 family metallopeptidase [Wenzhouxiangellaceae bacterium]|nr:M15 family metallopeptidase [Wenzhouxiangellaceae bacterium]